MNKHLSRVTVNRIVATGVADGAEDPRKSTDTDLLASTKRAIRGARKAQQKEDGSSEDRPAAAAIKRKRLSLVFPKDAIRSMGFIFCFWLLRWDQSRQSIGLEDLLKSTPEIRGGTQAQDLQNNPVRGHDLNYDIILIHCRRACSFLLDDGVLPCVPFVLFQRTTNEKRHIETGKRKELVVGCLCCVRYQRYNSYCYRLIFVGKSLLLALRLCSTYWRLCGVLSLFGHGAAFRLSSSPNVE